MDNRELKKPHIVAKIIWQIFIVIFEVGGIGLLVAAILNHYYPTSDFIEHITRFFIGSSIYEVIVLCTLTQINDIKQDTFLALLSHYRLAELYCETHNEFIKNDLSHKLEYQLANDTLNDIEARQEFKKLSDAINKEDISFIKYQIIRFEHLYESETLKWRYSFLLCILKNPIRRDKMKKRKTKSNNKLSKYVLVCLVIIAVPLLAISLVKLILKINIFDNPDFWYGYMAYIGSVLVAGIAMYQNQKTNQLSLKFDEMNAKQNYCMARATKDCTISVRYKDDATIIYSSFDKEDAGAIILIENDIKTPEQLDEYCVDLFFKDYSKSAIKRFEIIPGTIMCSQMPSNNGLHWEPEDHSMSIRTSFVMDGINDCRPKWIDDNVFLIKLKIYAPNNYIFSNMIANNEKTGLSFQAKLTSVCGISTWIDYKYWIVKSSDGMNIELCYSEIEKIEAEEEQN